jgi:hypothetical protein
MKSRATTLYPFVPSGPSFESALAFFAELGFQQTWRHDGYAGLRFEGAYFILQDIDVPDWQKNQMVTFEVDDLDAYWSGIKGRQLETRFRGARTRPPTDFAWGREVHIVDPAGVCWHVRQAAGPRQ